MIKIVENEKCWQCEKVKEQIADFWFKQGGQFRICEECFDDYLEGRIKHVDAHEVAE